MDSGHGEPEVQCRDKDWQEIEAQCKMLDESQLWISDLSLSSPCGQGDSVAYELGVQTVSAGREAAKFRVVMGGPQEEPSRMATSSNHLVSSNSMNGSPASSAGVAASHASDVFPISSPNAMCASPPLHAAKRPMQSTLSDSRQDSYASAEDVETPLRSPALSAASSRSFNSGRADFDTGSMQASGGLPHSGTWQAGWSGSNDGRMASYPPLEVEFVDGTLADDGYPPLEVDLVDGSLRANEVYGGQAEDAGYEIEWRRDPGEWGENHSNAMQFPQFMSANKLSPKFSLKSLQSEADGCLRMADYAPFKPITPQPDLRTQSYLPPHQRQANFHSIFRVDRGDFEYCGSMSVTSDGNHDVSPGSSSGSLSASSRDNSGKLLLTGLSRSLDVNHALTKFDLPSPNFPSSTSDTGKLSSPSPGSETGRTSAFRPALRDTSPRVSGPAWSAVVPSLSNKLQKQPSVGPTILEEDEGEGSSENGSCMHARQSGLNTSQSSSLKSGAAAGPRMTLFQAMSGRLPLASNGACVPRSCDSDAKSEASSYMTADRASLPTLSPRSTERGLKKSNSANERKCLPECGEEEGEPQLVRRASSGNRSQEGGQAAAATHSLSETGSMEATTPKMPRRPVYLGSSCSFRKAPSGDLPPGAQPASANAEAVRGAKYQPGVIYTANNGAYKAACPWGVLPIRNVDNGRSHV